MNVLLYITLFLAETGSRQSSAQRQRQPPAAKRTVNFDENDEQGPYQLSNKQEVGEYYHVFQSSPHFLLTFAHQRMVSSV